MLISRRSSQFICGLGLMQLLFATGLTVCGFVILGLFHNLQCKGLWAGLPMMIPGLLSVVVLATRHRKASITVFATSVIIIAICAYHGVDVWEDIDFWEKYREYAETAPRDTSIARPCYNRGDHCICSQSQEYLDSGYTVQYCDQFRTGEELFWTLIALTIGGVLFSILNAIVCVWASFTGTPRELEVDEKDQAMAEFDIVGSKNNYALHNDDPLSYY